MSSFNFRIDPGAVALSGSGTEGDPFIIPTGYASLDIADVQAAISLMYAWAGEDSPDFDICQPNVARVCEDDDACLCTGVIHHILCEPPFMPPDLDGSGFDEDEDLLPDFPDFWVHMIAPGGPGPGGLPGGGRADPGFGDPPGDIGGGGVTPGGTRPGGGGGPPGDDGGGGFPNPGGGNPDPGFDPPGGDDGGGGFPPVEGGTPGGIGIGIT